MKQDLCLAGRYTLGSPFASGGMATVYLGWARQESGEIGQVAIKRLHQQFVFDHEFRSMFLDEANIVSHIHHANVVPVLDVVEEPNGIYIVMEYVEGENVARLVRLAQGRGVCAPLGVVVRVLIDALRGLHAAHEARNESGEPLNIVHRDVSPQNLLVGTDGVTRVVDFGIAKAAERISSTHEGQLKGKPAYMSPEQILGGEVDRRTDVFAAGIVLWEFLTGERLNEYKSDILSFQQILFDEPRSARALRPEIPEALDRIVLRALSRSPASRYPDARSMAEDLEVEMHERNKQRDSLPLIQAAESTVTSLECQRADSKTPVRQSEVPTRQLTSPRRPSAPPPRRPSAPPPRATAAPPPRRAAPRQRATHLTLPPPPPPRASLAAIPAIGEPPTPSWHNLLIGLAGVLVGALLGVMLGMVS